MSDVVERARCKATAKSSGDRCGNKAIPGGTVCRMHGGAAPQVIRSARRRLLELVDPSIASLAEILEGPTAQWECLEPGWEGTGVWRQVGYSPETKLRAAEAILDRTGYPRRQELDVTDARARLADRIAAELGETDA